MKPQLPMHTCTKQFLSLLFSTLRQLHHRFPPTLNQKKGCENFKSKPPKKPGQVATPIILTRSIISRGPTVKTHPVRETPTQELSWVTVVRNGHKKARIDTIQKVIGFRDPTHKISGYQKLAQSFNKPDQQLPKGKSVSGSESNDAIFLRLPMEHEWRKLSPAGIRKVIMKKLAI